MKLVVIGGVAAGASTAARARRLDEQAEIVVFEKSHHVSFANCGLPYHIGEVITDRSRLLLQTPQSLRESLNIDVRIATEVLSIDRVGKTVTVKNLDSGEEYQERYDKLALCMGADAIVPQLPGIDLPGIHVLRRIGDMDQIKAELDAKLAAGGSKPVSAVVVGAGYIGLEMAENLKHRGASVEVVERANQILPPLDKEMSVPVEQHLRSRGVGLQLGASVAAFAQLPGETALTVELDNHKVLKADLVILAAGVRPNVALATAAGIELGQRGGIRVDTHMQTSDPNIWAAGDGVETPNTVLGTAGLAPLAGPANRQARVAAENICGRTTEYKSTQGTSIVKVFDMVAGGTGATEKQLKTAGISFESIHVHPSGHAGYYPGTAMMHLKVIFDPQTGQLLGAQASGFDGIDKRLDVLAVAVRQKMTVFDLEEQELAYAPPFGSAKDPINMAGFVAANVVRGDLKIWKSEDYPENIRGMRLIDVRTPEEYGIWHMPGAENVPLANIRAASAEWNKDDAIRLYCAVGFRSYLANRALVQRGFTNVATLSGGSTTLKFFHELEPQAAGPLIPIENYAERESVFAPANAGTGVSVDLDCTGLACPGPIMKMAEKMKSLNFGDQIRVRVSDPGFALDAPAWAKTNGHTLLDLTPDGPGFAATIRKGGAGVLAASGTVQSNPGGKNKVSFVVFSGDLDKLIAAFIIANGALSMGQEVSMFFTFWGLNALRAPKPPKRSKAMLERMFGMMMPSDASHTSLSKMKLAGAGTAMIKWVMKRNGVQSLPALMKAAMEGGANIVGCTMTMDLLGIAKTDLMAGVEFGGVATFLGEAAESQTTLFI